MEINNICAIVILCEQWFWYEINRLVSRSIQYIELYLVS